MSTVNLIVNSILDSKENFKALLTTQAGTLMIDTEGQQVVEDKIVSGIKIGDGQHSWEELEYLPLDTDTADVWRKLVSTATSNSQLITLPTVNFAYLTVTADNLTNSQYESVLQQIAAKEIGLAFSTYAEQKYSSGAGAYITETGLLVTSPNNYLFLRNTENNTSITVDRITFNDSESIEQPFTILFRDSATANEITLLEKKVSEEISTKISKTEEKISEVQESIDEWTKVENILGYESGEYGFVTYPTGAAAGQSNYFLAADGQWREIALDANNISYNDKNLQTVLNDLFTQISSAGAAIRTYSGSQYGYTYVASLKSMPATQGAVTESLICHSGVKIDNSNGVLFGAAWNDIAEYRTAIASYAAGNCLIDKNGILIYSNEDRQPNCCIVSDTYGFCLGPEGENNIPIAITGRVLAYAKNRDKLRVGDAVCGTIRGEVRKMKWWEKILYPQCIVGFVSEIPNYEYWGEHNTVVNNRIWIRVR